MQSLIKPQKLCTGDTIATISLSGGRAGDPDMRERYEIGKQRLKEIFGLNVIETPNCLKGNEFLYNNPKARAEDFIWALTNSNVKGIIMNMGGDDGARVLPYIDFEIIRRNPKVFLGFSDASIFHMMFTYAGVSSFYGANLLATIAQPEGLDKYTENWIRKVLFWDDIIGTIEPCKECTTIEWNKRKEVVWTKNSGYEILQGAGKVNGRLLGGCCGSIQQIMGTEIFPKLEQWKDSIVFLEVGTPYGTKLATLHQIRAFAATGMFSRAKGIICASMDLEDKDLLLKVIGEEEGLYNLPILYNVDFGHRIPMTVIPIGARAEMNCDNGTLTILESGVLK